MSLLMDMVCGYLHDQSGTATLQYGIVDLTEESLEFLGITLFFLALLDYLIPDGKTLRLIIREAESVDRPKGGEDRGKASAASAITMIPLPTSEMPADSPSQEAL